MTQTFTATLPTSSELAEVAEQVWASFLEGDLITLIDPDDDSGPGNRMVAWVAISGDWTGHLQVVATTAGAHDVAAGMFQLDTAEVSTAEVADALGEIANMIGGAVKGMVGVAAVLSLPQVVLDAAALISPDASEVVKVPARWNEHLLEISLWERQTHHRTGEMA